MLAGETILVVEDNALNMELITDILESHGYHVAQTTTGAKALQFMETNRPHLILMDVQLPGLDGLTVTGAIKDNPETRNIPIIALTAHAMRGDEEKAREAGCDDYISKPIDTRKLPVIIRSYLDRETPSN
ncbi:MAG: response regulator [bacterium]|nr:response regulator [bacterium]